jgi:TetR/AcrR family transcriptional repressor of nem operon
MPAQRDTRERLLATAQSLIAEAGYGAASVEALCRHAGVNKGSFYHFFPSKAALAQAAFEAYWECDRRLAFDAIFSPTRLPLDRLDAFASAVCDGQTAGCAASGRVPGCPYLTLGSEIAGQDEELRAVAATNIERLIAYVRSAIRDAQAAHQLPAGDAESLARDAVGFINGLVLHARIANDLAVFNDLPARLRRMLGAATA